MRKLIKVILVALVFLLSIKWIAYSQTANISTQPIRESKLPEKQPLPADFIPRTLKIAAIGDSLTQGVGDSTNEGGYLKYLQDDLLTLKGIKTVDIENYGKKGYRTTDLLHTLDGDDVQQSVNEADVVIITIGGNDIMKIVRENFFDLDLDVFQEEQKKYETRLNQIIAKVRNLNGDAAILLVGLYNPFQEWLNIDEFQQILADWNNTGEHVVSQFENTYFVEIHDIFMNNTDQLLYEDYFHPNDRGYQLIAVEVFDTLTEDVETEHEEWFVKKEE